MPAFFSSSRAVLRDFVHFRNRPVCHLGPFLTPSPVADTAGLSVEAC